jgi:hypothetical protein
MIGDGHVIIGGTVSPMNMLKAQVAVFLATSVAVHVTVVNPKGNVEFDKDVHEVVTPATLSIATGALKVADIDVIPFSGVMAMSAGHEMVGGIVSGTVTTKLQVVVVFALLMAVHVTVVVDAAGNVLPETGLQNVALSPALSDAVAKYDAVAKKSPGLGVLTRLAGHEMMGGLKSITAT